MSHHHSFMSNRYIHNDPILSSLLSTGKVEEEIEKLHDADKGKDVAATPHHDDPILSSSHLHAKCEEEKGKHVGRQKEAANIHSSSRYIHTDPILASLYSTPMNEEENSSQHTKTNHINDGDTDQRNDIETFSKESGKAKWKKVKSIVHNSSKRQTKEYKSSMTDEEKAFLSMRNKYSEMKETNENQFKSKTSFATIVDAAIARARLRTDLSMRLSRLTVKEADFLKELVSDDNVTKQQLEHADYVLNTDPLYCLPGETSTLCSLSSVEKVELPRNRRLSEVIHINGNDIEIMCNSNANRSVEDDIKMNETDEVRHDVPNNPSPYSYSTWQKNNESCDILGLPNEFNQELQVLSPPMMDKLRANLPFTVADDQFWLKYAMVKNGASLHGLYNSIRQCSKTLVVIETVNGEVFGAFVSSPWRKYSSFYGSCETFLWRLRKSRFTPTMSIDEQIELERDIEVFKWSQENRNIQMSNDNKLIIGGGCPDDADNNEDSSSWGFGIALEADLYQGTSGNCVTFNSPSLSQVSPKGDIFEVANMEVWVSR